ncbi:MAG: lipid hydroperoxide peroxidase [Bacteroidetes bacterium]|nr:MAG: lipid hydroperoxide peroxidase [Bacteroidota bacterium]
MKVTFGGNGMELLGKEIKVGEKAPEFVGQGLDLQPVKLSDSKGKVRVIAVFPSIDTPVCNAQAGRFNQEAAKLGDGVAMYTVSADLPFALGKFCAAEGVQNMTMMSDHLGMEFGQKYGFELPGLRLLARGVVVIDKDDVVQYVEYVPEVTNEPDYDKALAAIKSLL